MIPIVSIVGKSNSGKTTLIDNLIALAGDRPLPAEVPCFDRDDAVELTDLIVERFLKEEADDHDP